MTQDEDHPCNCTLRDCGKARRQWTQKSAPNRTGFPGAAARPVASLPRQKHQVGRFLCISEKRAARRSYLRTHGETTSKIRDLHRTGGHREIGGDFSSGDPVAETTFQ